MINPCLDKNPKHRSSWATPGWLPQEIGITLESGNLLCSEGAQLLPFRNYRGTAVYELVGLVVDVKSAERQNEHLVSFIDGQSLDLDISIYWTNNHILSGNLPT